MQVAKIITVLPMYFSLSPLSPAPTKEKLARVGKSPEDLPGKIMEEARLNDGHNID